MRISDWSSDVCSSDLSYPRALAPQPEDDDLPRDRDRADDEHDVAERPYPAQRFKEALLKELGAARIPHARRHARFELEQPDRQQAGEDHQHKPGVDRKSTRLNSSHQCATRMTSSACKKKPNNQYTRHYDKTYILYTQ